MKVAICFWGLTRSLKYTLDSINNYIFDVFKINNVEYRIFMHTYTVHNKYNNSRAGEKDITLNNEEYKCINPDYVILDNQEEVKSSINFLQYRTRRDPWNNNYETMDNFILAMYSKKRLLELFQDNDDGSYTHFLMIRPDVKYLNNFDINWLTRIKDDEIYVPNFGIFGSYGGFNDRMALMCNKKVFVLYNSVFDMMLEYSKKHRLHSESINRFNMNTNKIITVFIPFYFNRVRANGYENTKGDGGLKYDIFKQSG